VDGETVAECYFEILTGGRHAEDAVPLMRTEIVSASEFSDDDRRELLASLDNVEGKKLFGHNAVTERIGTILTEYAEFRLNWGYTALRGLFRLHRNARSD
jgi:hypothetical protein